MSKRTCLRYCLDMQKALRTLVFCNKIETCRKVENVLKRSSKPGEQELMVLPYHGAIQDGQRVQNLKVLHTAGLCRAADTLRTTSTMSLKLPSTCVMRRHNVTLLVMSLTDDPLNTDGNSIQVYWNQRLDSCLHSVDVWWGPCSEAAAVL